MGEKLEENPEESKEIKGREEGEENRQEDTEETLEYLKEDSTEQTNRAEGTDTGGIDKDKTNETGERGKERGRDKTSEIDKELKDKSRPDKKELVERKAQKSQKEEKSPKEATQQIRQKAFFKRVSNKISDVYDKHYKKLLIIPISMLVLSLLVIGFQFATTGSFINKDIALKGGVTLTITKEGSVDIVALEKSLKQRFKGNDVSVRSIHKMGVQTGIIAVADIDGANRGELNSFLGAIESFTGYELSEEDYSIEVMKPSLGASFFREMIIAVIVAFILMSIVVFIYFRVSVPSLAVVLSAFSDIVITLAIVNLMGMRIGTGGIAAFLMLIGYSVDTDILLATRVLKRKEGMVVDRVVSAFKTGIMMTLTTIGALIVGIVFIESEVIRQIMIIVLIGTTDDIFSTWIQNAGILRYYLERKAENELKTK